MKKKWRERVRKMPVFALPIAWKVWEAMMLTAAKMTPL